MPWMWTKRRLRCVSHNITLNDGQYDDVEYAPAICALNDAIKHVGDHHDVVNRIEIRLKTRCHVIPLIKFVVESTINGAFVCNVASKVIEAIVAQMTVCFYQHCWAVLTDTCCLANDLISWLKTCDMAVLSIKDMRGRCISSQLLVISGHWDSFQSFVPCFPPKCIDSSHAISTTRAAIQWYDKPHFLLFTWSSQQLFIWQKLSNVINISETCWTTLFKHIVSVITAARFSCMLWKACHSIFL